MLIFAQTPGIQLHVPAAWWLGTLAWFLALLTGDLLLNRKAKEVITLRTAVLRSAVWISLGLLLGTVIWLRFGSDAGGRYFAGFLIEKSLSVDNIFVWSVILTFFNIPKRYHYKVLFWGIFGAIVFRAGFVVAGLAVIEHFQVALVLLGIGLLILAFRMLEEGESAGFDPGSSRIVKAVDRVLPIAKRDYGKKLFARENGKFVVTMLFFTICVIELTDILFAIDSVPAVMAVARDPYIVLSSNIAAILGLRALYFVFAWLKDRFDALNKALALILSVLGLTLIVEPKQIAGLHWVGISIPNSWSIGFVIAVLAVTITYSLVKPGQKAPRRR